MDELSPDDFIDQKFLPLPYLMPPTEPLPLVRFKANVTDYKIYLCAAYFHKALDSTGVSIALKTLSEFCRDSNASPDSLPTNNNAEELSREHLLNFSGQSSLPFNWTVAPLDVTPPEDPGKIPISCQFKLSAEKIALLKDTCKVAITSISTDKNAPQSPQLTSNDIITALIGLCGNRARFGAVPESIPSSPKVIIAANIRKPSLLPATYVGNALAAVETSYDAEILPKEAVIHDNLPVLLKQDLARLANIAFGLRTEVSALTKDYIQGILRTIADTQDWSTFLPLYGSSIIVSSLRWMNFYLDFGPLGKVQRYDIPKNKVKGGCWVLPAKDSGDGNVGLQPIELRFVLERVAMERLQEDGLFRWMLTE